MSSEKFCLRWNDFERNISSAFRDIREEKEFFDITLACDDEQLQAHKVILSACSPFFKNILRRNHHQHPLLYLKGVSFRDMEAVLNFMYHGEVNVAQDDLNSFLQVAEDLRVKGLTQNQSGNVQTESKKSAEIPKNEPNIPPHQSVPAPVSKRPRPTPPPPRTLPQPVAQQVDDDIEEIVPVVKSEPRDAAPTVMAAPIQPVVQQEQSMAMYDDGSQQMGASMMMTEQYDDSYVEEYEGQYGDQSYASEMGAQDTSGSDCSKVQCQYCEKWIHKGTITRHVKHQHQLTSSVGCPYCNSQYKNEASLSNHLRIKHCVFSNKV